MQHQPLSDCKHVHSFGQDTVRPGERRTWIVIGLTIVTMVVEITAGLVYGSMALLADGLHMGSHATALGITAFAYFYARRYAYDRRFSFGTGKVNALGGFTGALLLAGFALVMAVASIDRFFHPVEIVLDSAILVACIGLVVNGVCAFILRHEDHGHDHAHDNHHHHADHNLHSAYLHVLADALTSLLAIFALLGAKYFGLYWMDPAMGVIGAALITRWSWGLLRDTSGVLLDHQASDRRCAKIRHAIEASGHDRVSDLHVWAIGPNLYAAVISVQSDNPQSCEHYRRLVAGDRALAHVTVEVQRR
ncbi:MAG: CDF family Co(II)/Ni(II) efflux transporter DmeF [Gammaproteobacteria bacterium]|nr:CDF family Co(II)/Ni(II) efflux transporter DmeF [Gammaproteobacteria bacterium]